MNPIFQLRIISVLFVLFIANQCFGQVNFTDSNLPIIVINTGGQTIEDDPKITCDMGIIWNGEGKRNYLTDLYNDYNGKIGIEIRGSTSQQYPKKSYGLETRDDLGNNLNVKLLGLPKENDWVLYGAYPDKSLMRNEITYSLFEQIQPWSPKYVYCELVINNEYLGVYTLIEKIKIDNDRVDIAKLDIDDNAGDSITGGYVIKIDKPTGSSNIPWQSTQQSKLRFLYHDPKYDELSAPQRAYIKNYVSDFEDAIYSSDFKDPISGYRSYIDVESFIYFMLMQELGRTVDGYRSSSFMYKDKASKGGKLTCGPMWDFNLSYGNADYCRGYMTTGWQYKFEDYCGSRFDVLPPKWWARLLEDPSFTNELKCKWLELRSTILSKEAVNNWIDSTALYLDEAQKRNFTKWPILGQYINWNYFIGQNYDQEVSYLKRWFEERSGFLDNNLPGNCDSSNTDNSSNESKDRLIKLYPNPTTKLLYANIPINQTIDIKIFSIEGKQVDFRLLKDKIDLGHLPQGLYFVKMKNQFIKVVKI